MHPPEPPPTNLETPGATTPDAPRERRGLRPGHLLGLVLLGAFLVHSSRSGLGGSVGADIKYGQWIAERQELPATEPFSPFADSEVRWVDGSWLSQWLFYVVYRGGELLVEDFGPPVQALARVAHLFAPGSALAGDADPV